VSQPVAKDTAPKAVILPSDLAVDPPESLRKWLAQYHGIRLVVPCAAEGRGSDSAETWVYTGGVRPLPAAAGQAAQSVRQLAEGQEIRQQTERQAG